METNWEGPKYKRNDGAIRTYSIYLPDKELTLPSVTTVLSGTKDQESIDALAKWEAENPGVKEERAFIGSTMHSLIEHKLKYGGVSAIVSESWYMFEHHNTWLEDNKVVPKLIEGVVYWQSADGALGFAGSVDLVADVGGDLCIVDHKSSKKTKKLEWITDYVLQVSAYSKAIKSMYGVDVKGAYINIATAKKLQSFYLDYFQLTDGWREFYGRLKQYNERKTDEQTVQAEV
jgi:genome maintenance exonuclease 1